MPGNLLNSITDPLMSEAIKHRLQDLLDSPDIDRSPIEAGLRGFAAGALEGIQPMTSPLSIGSMLAGGTGLLNRIPRSIQTLGRMTPNTVYGGVPGPPTGSLAEGGNIIRQILGGR